MIRSLKVFGFKAFSTTKVRDACTPLAPFTVLIGPNGAGKSSILQAIATLGWLARGTINEMLQAHQWEYSDLPHLHSDKIPMGISVEVDLPSAQAEWYLSLSPLRTPGIFSEYISRVGGDARYIVRRNGRNVFITDEHGGNETQTTLSLPSSWLSTIDARADLRSYPTLVALADWAKRIRAFYFLDPVALRAPSRAKTDDLGPHGEDLAAFLARLKKSRPKDFARLIARVRHHYPRLVDLHIRRTNFGWTHLEVTEKWNGEQAKFNARQVSDGLLRLIAVAAMHELREPPSVLLIDEIENGLHPRLLGGLVAMLEELTKGGKTQVIATTHSPITLNYVSSPESVLLVTRSKGGGVQVTPMNETRDFESLREHFELGELWYNVGEDRLVPKGKRR